MLRQLGQQVVVLTEHVYAQKQHHQQGRMQKEIYWYQYILPNIYHQNILQDSEDPFLQLYDIQSVYVEEHLAVFC